MNKRTNETNIDNQPLARYSVLYLGTAVPSPKRHGLDSIQEPLSRRYSIKNDDIAVRGIEAWLIINKTNVQIQFIDDPSVILYYPILSLIYCASVRFATRTETGEKFPDGGGGRFVRLDSPAASQAENTQHPPIFAVSFRRTRQFPANECHCFIAKTKRIALALVQACYDAYHETTDYQDCSKVPLYYKINGSELKEIDHEIRLIPARDKEGQVDYLTNPQYSGFFYKTDQTTLDYWQISEQPKHDIPRSTSNYSLYSTRSRQHRLTRIRQPPTIDSYERIQDPQTGRDVYVRWLNGPTGNPEQIPSKEIGSLISADKQSILVNNEQKKSNRKPKQSYQQNNNEFLGNSFVPLQFPSPTFLPYGTPMTYMTLQLAPQPYASSTTTSPFWFFSV